MPIHLFIFTRSFVIIIIIMVINIISSLKPLHLLLLLLLPVYIIIIMIIIIYKIHATGVVVFILSNERAKGINVVLIIALSFYWQMYKYICNDILYCDMLARMSNNIFNQRYGALFYPASYSMFPSSIVSIHFLHIMYKECTCLSHSGSTFVLGDDLA